MSNGQILVLTAVHIEAKAIARALDLVKQTRHTWASLPHAPQRIQLTTIGIQAEHLPRNIQSTTSAHVQSTAETAVLPRSTGVTPVTPSANSNSSADPIQTPVSCIIMAGLAGALDPSLKVADIVIDDCPPIFRDGLSSASTRPTPSPSYPGERAGVRGRTHNQRETVADLQELDKTKAPDAAQNRPSPNLSPEYEGEGPDSPRHHVPSIHFGPIHTASKIATTPAEKAALFRQTGALAVDMENAIVRPWAQQAGVPLICVRAISDCAGQSLDPAMLRFIDDMGRVKPVALAAGLLTRPSLLPALIRLGADSQRAAKALGKAVRAIVERLR